MKSLTIDDSYIVSKGQDYLFVLFLPILLFLLFFSTLQSHEINMALAPFLSLIIYLDLSHLLLVFWRSHGNSSIYTKFKKRMLFSPLLIILLIALPGSVLFYVACFVALWDLWHVSMQNFGLARIYEMMSSKNPLRHRLSDQVIHLGIFLVPALFMTRFAYGFFLNGRMKMERLFDSRTPWGEMSYIEKAFPGEVQFYVLIIIFSVIFSIIFYKFFRQLQQARQGVSLNKNKWFFNASLALSVFSAFIFLPIEMAVTMMALLHSLQYYWIVWHKEKHHLFSKLPKIASLIIFVLITLLATFLIFTIVDEWMQVGVAIIVCIRILHFWYDGFIWSVRSKDVA